MKKIREKYFTEEEVVEGIRSHDRRFYDKLYAEAYSVSKEITSKRVFIPDEHLAHELAGEAIEVLQTAIQTKEHKAGNYIGYIAKTIKYKLINKYRTRQKEVSVGGDEEFANLSDENPFVHSIFGSEFNDTLEQAKKCFEQLNKKCQDVISSATYCEKDDRLTFRQIAQLYQTNEGNARVFHHNCIESIRKCMKAKGYKLA